MTLAELITDSLRYCEAQNAPYLESNADHKAKANQVLQEVSAWSYCLHSDNITFNVVSGTNSYSYRKPSATFVLGATQVALVEVVSVHWLTGGVLEPVRDIRGRTGLVPLDELERHYPNYKNTTSYPAGDPRFAYFMPPTDLVIWPTPNVNAAWKVRAYYQHPLLSNDADELLFPQWIDEMLIVNRLAFKLMLPYANGESRTQLMTYLQESQSTLEAYRARLRGQMEARGVRGGPTGNVIDLNS